MATASPAKAGRQIGEPRIVAQLRIVDAETVAGRRAGTSGIFPFRLGQQPVRRAGPARQPGCTGARRASLRRRRSGNRWSQSRVGEMMRPPNSRPRRRRQLSRSSYNHPYPFRRSRVRCAANWSTVTSNLPMAKRLGRATRRGGPSVCLRPFSVSGDPMRNSPAASSTVSGHSSQSLIVMRAADAGGAGGNPDWPLSRATTGPRIVGLESGACALR